MRVNRLKKGLLPLHTSGELAIVPVGCGGAFSKLLYQNNYLIAKGDTHVMVDCGTRTPMALSRLGRSVTDISTWLITHSHADHIGGLEEVMLMGRYFAKKKPSVIITREYEKTLWDMSLSGANAFNERHDGKPLTFSDYWETIRPVQLSEYPRDTREVVLGDLNIKLVRTRHYPEQAEGWEDAAYSVGLVIDDRVLFTGDTRFDPELLHAYNEKFNFELILHDVQFFTGGVHAGLDELITLPRPMRERILLMHYGDAWKKHRKRVSDEGFMGFVEQHRLYSFD